MSYKNKIEDYTIDEIVQELSKREGVEIDNLNTNTGMTLDVEGPVIVIVIDK